MPRRHCATERSRPNTRMAARTLPWNGLIDIPIVCQSFAGFPNWPFRKHEVSLENVRVFKGLVLVSGAEFEPATFRS